MRGWQQRYRLSTRDCHNAVIVFRRHKASSAELRERITASPELSRHLASGMLNYTIRKLDG